MARGTSVVESLTTSGSVVRDQELARKLLIELLSYQFAFPVRWIETQNEFFERPENIERYVEIGPSKILATMAKKTAAQQYSSQTASTWSRLQFLSYSDNKDDVYYEYPEDEEPASSLPAAAVDQTSEIISGNSTASTSVSNTSTKAVAVVNAAGPTGAPVASAIVSVSAGSATSAVDISLSAGHIVLALTAQKLKRAFDGVSTQKTIRELSGGKSTLQNELIGDLGAEFGNLPDGAEDFALEALGDALQGNFSGKPGKQISALISKMISSKMPAGFNHAAIQDHLQAYWGIGRDHSIIPMCFAVTAEPPSRLADTEKAKDFLNSLLPRYASYAGITLVPGGNGGAVSTAQATVTVDSASLNAVKKEQRDFQMKQFELLAKYLQIDDLFPENEFEALKASEKALEDKLNCWNSEFDDQFFSGIQSTFDVRKIRKYDSWWNWVREDLVRLVNEVALGQAKPTVREQDDRMLHILSKWEPTCSDLVQHLATELSRSGIQNLVSFGKEISRRGSHSALYEPMFKYNSQSLAPKTIISSTGVIEYTEVLRSGHSYSQLVRQGRLAPSGEHIPFVHIRKRHDQKEWTLDQASTELMLEALDIGSTSGLTFAGKAVLVTGAGPKSIGAEVVQGLLCGGARVLVTTSRSISSTAKFYQRMYRKYGARGSALTVVPFNQGSKKDCESLIELIFSSNSPTGGDLDYIVPFAAISEAGELDGLDGKSELAHRAMLVNILRLLGCVRKEKEQRNIDTRPTTVILPLSPNHGTFGGDGLYAESKLGLETLFNRFHSESWSSFLTICGAVIGWTRGTGLMSGNNIVAETIEKHDAITFSQTEMAFNILALMTPAITAICEDEPLYADLNGGLQFVVDLKQRIADGRAKISDESRLRKALLAENARQQIVLLGPGKQFAKVEPSDAFARRANLGLGFPDLPCYRDLTHNLADLKGMVDLSRTVVVVGFSELGPWGSTRTRWEMEHLSNFTFEGYVEMAWIMGLVKHFEGDIKGQTYAGWIDAKTQEPVKDQDFESKYRDQILSHTGLRFIEPEGLGGYDPAKKEFLHEVAVEDDLSPFESSKATAEAFKLRHGDKVAIRPIAGSDDYMVHVKKGAHFLVPKATSFDRMVAGQLPSGWDPLRYGIPEDIVQQVDPITLYALCCVSEALLSAGITDPYELYKHIHVSELINCLGTGAGALLAMRGVYRDRYLDRPVQSDILQESFLNTMGAWINMLLLSSTGPIKSPVGACATAIESLDIGCDAVQSGKSRVAIIGGCDDFQEEMSFEFAKMKATASSVDEIDKGRLPNEMSRPSASSRSGFVESAGCGVQIIMSAELALEMGLPIYGIIAYAQMASDKIGRSVPAPGKGILTAAREAPDASLSDLLDLEHRRRHLKEAVAEIKRWHQSNSARIRKHPGWSNKRLEEVDAAAACKLREAQRMWGNDIRQQDPSIAPIRASLATWGLTVNDIQVASMHGTSTKANDTNEADVINQQMSHLGRSKGNPLLAVCQKSLTGHPKGAAGAWQFNGCMQMMQTGIVPGNKNADNIDNLLRNFEHIVYPMETIQMTEVKATMLTSFGFGQKGAITIAIAPKYLYSVLAEDVFEDYRQRVTKRQKVANTEFQKGIISNSVFKAKIHSPWENSDMALSKVLLDPKCRVSNGTSNELKYNEKQVGRRPGMLSRNISTFHTELMAVDETGILSGTIQNMLESSLKTRPSSTSVGVDVESISSINIENETFIKRNFTSYEQQYCFGSADPRASFAGRWSAKEAVFKSLQVASHGPGAALNEIEILSDFGVPKVQLHGKAKDAALAEGITSIQVSITHSDKSVTAVALAGRS